MNTKVKIEPIERKKWHGKAKEESFAQPHTIQALVDGATQEYAVDIREEDQEFFDKKKVKYDLSTHFDPDNPHPFWDSSSPRIKLHNRTMFLDKSIVLDRIKLCVIRASKYVANSYEELEDYPEATHYIHDEISVMKDRAAKEALEDDAIIASHKLPKSRKLEILKVLSGGALKEQSEDYIFVLTKQKIKEDPELFLRMTKRDKKEIANLSLVYEALDKNVLRKSGHKITFNASTIGADEEKAASYLGKDENQELMLLIKNKLN